MQDDIIAQIWFEFLAGCRAAATKDELGDLLVVTFGRLGFGYVNISLMRDYSLPKEELTFAWRSTYPEDWGHYYAERDCLRFDPVALSARGDKGPFFWADLKYMLHLTPLQTSFLALANEAGLYNGIGLPFVGPNSLQGGIALATLTSDTPHVRDLDLLWSISNLFYRRLRELILGPVTTLEKHVRLTPRETDILTLSAEGLTDRAIAENLNIADNTVNTHFRKAYAKFDAHSRVQAYARAVKMGLINLP
jgi:DNA-binding CsgD family transcriptional regulator